MKISLVTPAGKRSRAGNRQTAVRWARIIRDLGHRVAISETFDGRPADMLVAVHAWRSADSVQKFADAFPDRPLIVVLSGTDIYRFQYSHREKTISSMERATSLVCLHELAHRVVPKRFHRKLRVVHQSASPLSTPRAPSRRYFDVCVVGHLREEKDSLRAAYAARHVPPASRLRVINLGKAHDETWAREAREEMRDNPRYFWRGEVSGWQVRRQFVRSHAMVISSIMEGGANVVSEAIVAGLPILASRIDGNVGLLGETYSGYFPAKDTGALANLLWRAEDDPNFLKKLTAECRQRRPLFRPERERAAWRTIIKEFCGE